MWGFSVWFRRTGNEFQIQGILGNMPKNSDMGPDIEGSWSIYLQPSQEGTNGDHAQLSFSVRLFSGNQLHTFSTLDIECSKWNNFIMTGNGEVLNAYLNRAPVSFWNNDTRVYTYDQPLVGPLANTPHPLYIGWGDPLNDNSNIRASFTGEMKAIGLYNVFIDQKDVDIIYARTVDTLPTPEPTLAPTPEPSWSHTPTVSPTTAVPTRTPSMAPTAPLQSEAPTTPGAGSSTSLSGEKDGSGSGTTIALLVVGLCLLACGGYYYRAKNQRSGASSFGSGVNGTRGRNLRDTEQFTSNPMQGRTPVPEARGNHSYRYQERPESYRDNATQERPESYRDNATHFSPPPRSGRNNGTWMMEQDDIPYGDDSKQYGAKTNMTHNSRQAPSTPPKYSLDDL